MNNGFNAVAVPLLVSAFAATGVFSTAASAQSKVSSARVVVVAVGAPNVGAWHNKYALRRSAHHGVYVHAPRLTWLPLDARDGSRDLADSSEFDEDDEFQSADADNDGFISLREARHGNAAWARDFRRIDTSGDGFLTQEEIGEFYKR
jgi:EF hand